MNEKQHRSEDDLAGLIRRVMEGETRAFSRVVMDYQDDVRACLAVRLRDFHEAEDLAQEVFVVAYRRLAEFDPSRPMGPWLRGIALNLLRNHTRKRRAVPVGQTEGLAELIDRQIERGGLGEAADSWVAAMRQCLQKLGRDARQIIAWRYEEGLSLADLAQRTRKKHSALTMQLHRLRTKIRSCIESRLSRETT